MTEAFIALGSNLGDRRAQLLAAVDAIAALPGTRVVACSAFIETQPVGPVPQGLYLNGVVHVETALGARALLESLLAIEAGLGRDRASAERWGPRTVDLDLLLYGSDEIDEPGLHVPHPRLSERRFVLEPLCELAPELIVPGVGRSVRELYGALVRSEAGRCC